MSQTTQNIQARCSYSYFSICSLPDFHGPIRAGRHTESSTTGNIKAGNLQEGKSTKNQLFIILYINISQEPNSVQGESTFSACDSARQGEKGMLRQKPAQAAVVFQVYLR